MKKKILSIMVSGFLVFTACEKQALNPDQDISSLKKSAGNELHQNNMSNNMNGMKVLNFRAHLSGDQEVPEAETNATGQAIFQLSKDGEELSYKLIVANIENVRMAHIHLAPEGVNGPVGVWLYPSAPPPQLIEGVSNGILAEGVITKDDLVGSLAGSELSELVELMLEGGTYVNVHTNQYPAGEIRGQIFGNTKMH